MKMSLSIDMFFSWTKQWDWQKEREREFVDDFNVFVINVLPNFFVFEWKTIQWMCNEIFIRIIEFAIEKTLLEDDDDNEERNL